MGIREGLPVPGEGAEIRFGLPGSRLGCSRTQKLSFPLATVRNAQVRHSAYEIVVDSIASRHAVQPTSLSRTVRLQPEPMCKL